MASRSGSYTRSRGTIFTELTRWFGALHQQGAAAVDVDYNDTTEALLAYIARATREAGVVGAVGVNDWKIAQAASTANNFKVTGGGGTLATAAWLFGGGLPALLLGNVDYVSTDKQIHPQVTTVSALVLTDSSANYVVNELAGRVLVPDVDNPGTNFLIASNTATTVTISSGDLTAATSIGKSYRVNLSTPGGARTDSVYLDLFLDEIDGVEDSTIKHNIGSPATATEAARRLKLQTFVRVRENGSAPVDYTDIDGNAHFVVPLATLDRTATADILTADINDLRTRVHANRQDNPHAVTAAQVNAISSVAGVEAPGDDVEIVGVGLTVDNNGGAGPVTLTVTAVPGALPDETLPCKAGVQLLDTVYMGADGDLDRANATAVATGPALGFVVDKPTGTTATIRGVGIVDGFVGLTVGDRVFLGTSDGGYTQTAPDPGVQQVLGVAISTTEIRTQVSLEQRVVS